MFLKNKLEEYAGLVINKISQHQIQPFKFIENQHKIIYFAVFDLEFNKFKHLYEYIKSIKETLFVKSIQVIKYALKEIVQIDNNSETEKIKILFSVCFLYYYHKFSYNKCESFDIFFNKDIFDYFTNSHIKIINDNKFKIFCYSFYYYIINELNQRLIPDDQLSDVYNKSIDNSIHFAVNKKIIQPLISTKERIVDMIYSFHQNIAPNIFKSNTPSDLSNTPQTDFNNTDNSFFEPIINKDISPTNNLVQRKSAFETKLYSQTILSEINKNNSDPNVKLIIDLIRQNIDTNALNEMKKKIGFKNIVKSTFPFIYSTTDIFSSYFKEYISNIPDGYTCRFIYPEASVYMKAFEIYFTLYTLAQVNTNTFEEISKIKFNIYNFDYNDSFIQCLVEFYRRFTITLKNNENSVNVKSEEECLEEVLNKLYKEWESFVIKKTKEIINKTNK